MKGVTANATTAGHALSQSVSQSVSPLALVVLFASSFVVLFRCVALRPLLVVRSFAVRRLCLFVCSFVPSLIGSCLDAVRLVGCWLLLPSASDSVGLRFVVVCSAFLSHSHQIRHHRRCCSGWRCISL